MKAGIIGLGIMGRPMAANLLKQGFELYVHDIDPAAVEALRLMGAIPAGPAEMAGQCEAILTMLPDGGIVQRVLLGEDGVISRVRPGALVVEMSSITPEETRLCAARFEAIGVDYLDAPVSGGEPKAIDGSLAFMAGGSERAFKRAQPLFAAMGHSAVLVGGSGAGCVAKLANQIIVNLGIAAVSEALTFSVKAGADPGKVFKAIRQGLAASTVLDTKAPMMLAGNYKPGGKLSINRKDISNVMKTAHTVDMPLPLTAQLMEIMTALKRAGHMEEDHSGIVQFYEGLAGVLVRSEGGD